MFSRKILLVVVILFFVSPVLAAEPNTFLTLVDSVSKEHINDVFVKVQINDEMTDYYLEEGESLNLDLATGQQVVKFLVNDQSTEGFDYYGKTV